MEKSILFQNKKFEELAKLKQNIGSIIKETAQEAENKFDHYTVKEGDSLKRISRHFSVSVEELKKVNKLKDDLIMAGQEILIPKKIH